ncbi:MAG: 2,3-bisphosphoglycerate-independent phosphoglycerate mutase [Nanoarchaeota archaeon]
MTMTPYLLVIRDGWGSSENTKGNAISDAKTPYTNTLMSRYPVTMLNASGRSVGLPSGYMGNSEVGHMTMGSGRVIPQSLVRIDDSISDGSFFTKECFVDACRHVKRTGGTIHLMGLVQDQGVHGHSRHLYALLKVCAQQKVAADRVCVHVFTDGRDTAPQSAKIYMSELLDEMQKIGVGRVGTLMGRYYAMDRNDNWERTRIAYDALVKGTGTTSADAMKSIDEGYAAGETDEFITPRIITGYSGMKGTDAVIAFNYRLDRMRQLTHAFVDEDFAGFRRVRLGVKYVCMMEYYGGVHAEAAFGNPSAVNVLGEVLSDLGRKQLRISETEKYAHVTYFFNAQVEKPFPGEDRVMIPSKKVSTYDLAPEMCADEIASRIVTEMDNYDVIITNLVNGDMVGHTGKYSKILEGLEAVDRALQVIVEATLSRGGAVLVTADHGNAECATFADGSPNTAHTTNPVPFILVSEALKGRKLRVGGGLMDVAPTLLDVMGIPKPVEMSGVTLMTSDTTQ